MMKQYLYCLSFSRFLAMISALLLLGVSQAFGEQAAARGSSSVPSEAFKTGMHAVLTGVGARFSVRDEGGSGVLVIVDGEALQFDIGPMTVQRMAKAGFNPSAVGRLFISHLHMDHISAFPEYLSLSHMFGGEVNVYGPRGAKAMVSGAEAFLEFDFDAMERAGGRKLHVVVTELEQGQVVLETQDYTVSAVRTPHLDIEGPHSFAYRVQSRYGSIVISGDTAPSLNVLELAKGADLLIHEVFQDPSSIVGEPAFERLDPDTQALLKRGPDRLADGLRHQPPTFGHSVPAEVGKLAAEAGVAKLVLTHRPVFAATMEDRHLATSVWGLAQSDVSFATRTELLVEARRHFSGPVIMAEPLMHFEIGKHID